MIDLLWSIGLLVVSATVIFAYFWYETLKSKLTLHDTNPNAEENSITPLKPVESEFRSILHSENCDLKNKIHLATIDFSKVVKERNELASQRDELLMDVRRWQEKYDLQTLAMKNALEEYEREKKELVSTMLAREKNEDRFKSKIQDLQAALTTEHLRSAASLNQELQVRSELQVSKSRIAELELLNTRQRKRIAQIESRIDSFENQLLGKTFKTCKKEEDGMIDLITTERSESALPKKTDPHSKVDSEVVKEELEEKLLSVVTTRDYGLVFGQKGKRSVRCLWSYNLLNTSPPHGHSKDFN
jgi:chromosome segregation ATPase